MKLYSAGDQIGDGAYRRIASYDHASTYIGPSDRLLFAVTPTQGAGPLNLVMDEPDRLPDKLSFRRPCLYLENSPTPLRPDQLFRSSLPLLSVFTPTFQHSVAFLKQWLLANAPEESLAFLLADTVASPSRSAAQRFFRKRAMEAHSALREGDLEAAAQSLRGCGPGLTPAGDDFICGMLFTLRLTAPCDLEQSSRIFRVARGKSPVVNAFLEMARDGYAFERFHLLLHALQGSDTAEIEHIAKQLSVVGATSGVDLCVAFVLTWEAELKRVGASTMDAC